MNIINSIFIMLIIFSSASSAYAKNNNGKDISIIHISACGATLDEMTERLKSKSIAEGAKDFKITSAYSGNHYYGTAVLYK